LLQLWRRLRATRVDLLVLLTVVPNIWGRLLGRLAGAPLIVGNLRGLVPRRQYERWLWPLADHLLCNAAALKTLVTEQCGLPGDRVTVIPNGVDTDFFQPAPSFHEVPLRALAVARLVPDKDHPTLIRAFQMVAANQLQAELWLVGEGPREAAIRKMVRQAQLEKRVHFLPGQLDLRPLLALASFLVLSSSREAFPNVVLEAMAAGLPVVATRVGGLPEMVAQGETGLLVPPGDPPALAAAMSRVLADADLRRKLGRAGRMRVEQEFSLEAMVSRTAEVLLRLWSQAPRRRREKGG
jgi:glycosyltransferase involved in cell wall biosynthesis